MPMTYSTANEAIALAPQGLNAPTTEAQIIKATNGFIVRVGCKVFVAKEWHEVSEGLQLFFKDRNAAIKKYCKDDPELQPIKTEKIHDVRRNRPRKVRRAR